jgi:hypothetical protein
MPDTPTRSTPCTATWRRLAAGLGLAAALAAQAEEAESLAFAGGFRAPVPKAWVQETPSSSMRAAQYGVPGADAKDPAHFVVFYFGPRGGGSVEDNIARWGSQFTTPDGGPVSPLVEKSPSGRFPVTVADFKGNYARGVGMGQQGEVLPGQAMVAGIVETERGNLFVQLYGPEKTVKANRAGFEAFISGLSMEAMPPGHP